MPIAAIMQQVVTPASNRVWALGALVYEIDMEGQPPALSEEQWREAGEAAQALSQAAHALRLPGRPVVAPGAGAPESGLAPERIASLIDSQRDAWEGEIAAMEAAMVDVGAAIEGQDLASFADAGNVLYDACERCHRSFWYPEQ